MNQYNFRISERTLSFIEGYKKEHDLGSRGKALEEIIALFRQSDHSDPSQLLARMIAENVLELFEEKYSKKFTRIRLGVNNADRNSDLLLMLINHLIARDPTALKVLITKDTPQLKEAREVQSRKINAYKQRHDNNPESALIIEE